MTSTTIKTVFQTDHLGIYIGTTTADASPLEPGVWLIPARCVEKAPPVASEHQLPRWDGELWTLIDSYAGLTAYSIETGAPLVIERHGQLPSGYTLQAPGQHQVWNGSGWHDDIPAVVERDYIAKRNEISADCDRVISGGFWSEALGARHFYSSTLEDQLNLTNMTMRALPAAFPCVDVAGQKEFKEHSAAQLQLVCNELCEFKLDALQRADRLKKNLEVARLAKDVEAIAALSWDEAPL
jgi:hypothetical protein